MKKLSISIKLITGITFVTSLIACGYLADVNIHKIIRFINFIIKIIDSII